MADMATKYLETGSVNPAYNLAFEEYVLHSKTEGDYLLLWQNDNSVIIGRNQNAEEEINKKYVADNDIKVIRRNTGGGAVYHDLGNLNYSFITDVDDVNQLNITRFTDIVVASLRSLGLDAKPSGRNDILIEESKVSGTAQHLYKNRILYHGTLLFDSDPDKIAGALNVDETKFQSKSAKSVKSRVGNIKDFLKEEMHLHDFWEYLKKNMVSSGIEQEEITEADQKEIIKLKEEKYDTWEWNFGKNPAYEMEVKRRWPGGTLKVAMTVDKGIVEDIAIYGDFLALVPIDGLTESLKGCRFTKEAFREATRDINFSEVLGTITKDEMLETIFRE